MTDQRENDQMDMPNDQDDPNSLSDETGGMGGAQGGGDWSTDQTTGSSSDNDGGTSGDYIGGESSEEQSERNLGSR